MLTLNSLGPTIDAKSFINYDFAINELMVMKKIIKEDYKNNSFKLRIKKSMKTSWCSNQFFSFNRNNSYLTTKRISTFFLVSRSKIYRIKRMSLNQIMTGTERK